MGPYRKYTSSSPHLVCMSLLSECRVPTTFLPSDLLTNEYKQWMKCFQNRQDVNYCYLRPTRNMYYVLISLVFFDARGWGALLFTDLPWYLMLMPNMQSDCSAGHVLELGQCCRFYELTWHAQNKSRPCTKCLTFLSDWNDSTKKENKLWFPTQKCASVLSRLKINAGRASMLSD